MRLRVDSRGDERMERILVCIVGATVRFSWLR